MPLKIALVGAGHMGRIHLQKLMTLTEIQVVGVADTERKRVKKYRVNTGFLFSQTTESFRKV
jgi:predicted dehydrogenase